MYLISTRNCYEYEEVNRRESRRESCVVGVNLAICWLRAKVSWIFCWVNSARNARSSVSAWLRSYKKVSKKKWHQFNFNLISSPVQTIYLLALSLKLFNLQTSMNCSRKSQNMQFFAFFFFLVLIAYKKTEENVQLQNTVLHANFFVSFCLKFIFQYLIIFRYISIKNSCILLSFLVHINKSFFWNLYIFRFYVRFYYICVEMHWNRTLKHLILIMFVFKTSFNDYFDVMLIFICHWHKIDFFSWILFSSQNNPIKCQIIDKELKICCCHTVHLWNSEIFSACFDTTALQYFSLL